jgi:hypothetical protein
VGKARDKIEKAEKLIKEQGYLEIRLEQEKREIKALKHELEVMHIARDLPVPKVRSLRSRDAGRLAMGSEGTHAQRVALLLWCMTMNGLTKQDVLASCF